MRANSGFTIIDLLIALTILSAVAVVAITTYFSQAEITLENASVLLARDLRAAQNRSAYMAEAAEFTFTDDGDGYRVETVKGEVIVNPTTSLDFVRRYSEDAVFRGVRIRAVDCGGDGVLSYNERGRATESARITLEFDGEERVVLVDKGSGSVRILGSTSGWTDSGY